MTRDDRAEVAAALLLQARRSHHLLADIPFALIDEFHAYQIQALVTEQLGRRIGWKLGLNAAGVAIRAPLYADRSFTLPAILQRKHFQRFLLESELAVSFDKALPSRRQAYDRAEVQAAAGYIHAAFEIIDTRFEAWPEVDALWLLADGLSHGCFVLGEGVAMTNPDLLNFANYTLRIDDHVIQAEDRPHPQPDPWGTLTQLVNQLRAQGSGLAQGEIVTTGTFSGVSPLQAGQNAEVCFTGIGACRVELMKTD